MKEGSYMNSDYNMDFIMRIMNLQYSLDYDMDVFNNCILKFYIFISSDDELAESMMLVDALRIIDEAQALGAKLLDEYDECEEENDEENEDECFEEDEFYDDDDYENDDWSDDQDNENVIYLNQEEFDSLTEGFFEEFWEENEKSIYFLLQFEKEEDMDNFIKKEFNG